MIYDGYGALRSRVNVSTGAVKAADEVGFGGQYGYYTDTETGLVLCTHRYYDPGAGRWLTRDPIGYSGGVNLYGYAGGNPINEIDPSGFDVLDNIGAWVYKLFTGTVAEQVRNHNPTLGQTNPTIAAASFADPSGISPHVKLLRNKEGIPAGVNEAFNMGLSLIPIPGFADVEIAETAAVMEADPCLIRFTQNSCSNTLKGGAWNLETCVQELENGAKSAADFDPIAVFKMNGKMYSLDNRRLAIFQKAGKQIRYRWATKSELLKKLNWDRFSTNTDGVSILIKGVGNHINSSLK